MPDIMTARLSDRGVIEISGEDAGKFLHGLVTNDVEKLPVKSAVFAGLLTPKGKILADFFIYRFDAATFWIDCPQICVADLLKRFTLYKLRAKIDIHDRSGSLSVLAQWGDGAGAEKAGAIACFTDPRFSSLGERIFSETAKMPDDQCQVLDENAAAYHRNRIALAVPQGGLDYAYGETFPHEACYDGLNGVDFRKGCYIGQEVVSRMHHKGVAKTRIAGIELSAPRQGGANEITAGELPVGHIGSEEGLAGIALIRLDRAGTAIENGTPLMAGGANVHLKSPAWANYSIPTIEGA